MNFAGMKKNRGFCREGVTFQEGRHATCKRPQDDRAIAYRTLAHSHAHTHTHKLTFSYVRSFGKCFNNLDKVNTFRLFFSSVPKL